MKETLARVARLARANAHRLSVRVMRDPPGFLEQFVLYWLGDEGEAVSAGSRGFALSEFGAKLATVTILRMLQKRAVRLRVARLQSE